MAEVFGAVADDLGVPSGILIAIVLTLFLGALVLMFGVAIFPKMRDVLVRVISRCLPLRMRASAEEMIYSFADGLAGLRNPKRVAWILAMTMPVWFAEGAMYHIIGWAFDLDVSYHGSLFVTAMANLAVSLPSTAGGIGPFEYATRVVLEGFDEVSEVAAAYAVVIHGALLVPVTSLGLFFMWLHNLSLGEMTRGSSEKSDASKAERDNIEGVDSQC